MTAVLSIQDLKIQRTQFRLQMEQSIALIKQVVEMDRLESENDRPLSYMPRKSDKSESAG
jgi:hypothetical protein